MLKKHSGGSQFTKFYCSFPRYASCLVMKWNFYRACQLVQAAEGKFNPHIHVEYEWSLRLEEMDESDDDLDDKVIFSM